MIQTKVTAFLEEQSYDYEILEHDESAFTSQEAAVLRGVALEEMIKTMVFLNDDRNIVIAVVPAIKKVDMEKFKEEARINSLKFADEEDIKEGLGNTVGAIPPFYPGEDYPIYMDPEIFQNERVNFSAGVPDAGYVFRKKSRRRIMGTGRRACNGGRY